MAAARGTKPASSPARRRTASSPERRRTASSRAEASPSTSSRPPSSSPSPSPASRPPSPQDVPAAASGDALETYRGKRRFAPLRREATTTAAPADDVTPEPVGVVAAATRAGEGTFVIQKHWATRLHYDLRLELDGVMKSWAVPKGPSLDPRDKRMAVATEDHPIDYNRFDGQIPAGHYGAGRVVIWDNGRWKPIGEPRESLARGELKFELEGRKLRGRFVLVRTKARGGEKKPGWLLIKERDAYVRSRDEYDVLEALPDAVPALADGASTAAAANAKADAKPAPPKHGRPGPLPERIDPQLALAVSGVPADADQRLWEIKLDGYRLMARLDADGRASLHTRNAQDWSARFPTLVRAFEALGARNTWIDGELVALDARGLPSFEALQRAIADARTAALVYFAFDLPFVDGEDWRALPLSARRARLEAMVASPDDHIRLSQTFDAPPSQLAAASKAAGLEGLMGKRVDAPYRGGRTDAWVKLKHGHHEEFVIAGYKPGEGMREKTFGSLVLASHDEHGVLRHAGNVGSGFDEETLEALTLRLRALRVKRPVLDDPNKELKDAIWVRPELVAQITFAGVSREGHIKHAVYRGLREDKSAREVERERTDAVPSAAAPLAVAVTHPGRVIDTSSGVTKIQLVRYLQRVAPLMLEHLAARPVSWVRAPDGITGEVFFQKHLDRMTIPGIRSVADPRAPREAAVAGESAAAREPVIEIVDAQGLAGAAQMNVIEFHTWNATTADFARPDRFVLDLDPGDGVPWPQVQEAALLVRALLDELALPAFLKTSGGKGLHIVVPLRPEHEWDAVLDVSQHLAQHLARVIPQRFTATSGARHRVNKVYVDYLRNTRRATTVCAWSPRARPGLGVSVPIGWDELSRVTGGAHWGIANVDERLRIGNGPWGDYAGAAVGLGEVMGRLGGG
jgi:bifunctional non-homologous end joining protein LigD